MALQALKTDINLNNNVYKPKFNSLVKKSFDTIVIGGGLVGSAVACGIARKGLSVAILDGGDRDYRASRGNFGLVWVQGKGADYAPYAKWSGLASKHYSLFEQGLKEATGINVGLSQNGGFDFCLTEEEWDERLVEMAAVSRHTHGEFKYQMLDYVELKQLMPPISDEVVGASYSPHDGHLNPLYLLRGLQNWTQSLGGVYLPETKAISIRALKRGFDISTSNAVYHSEKVVLCGGLDNQRLTRDLDMFIPIHSVRGQLLVSERVAPFLTHPSLQIRQTDEGSLQIGDSHEVVGLNDGTTLDVMAKMARRAVTIFPHLSSVKLNRAWGALRVMTPDGLPVYHHSEQHPGAFALSCHSGVSLAALHAGFIADWIVGEETHPLISDFSGDRFDVPIN